MQESGSSHRDGPHRGAEAWHGAWMDRNNSTRARRSRVIFPAFLALLAQLPSAFVTFRNRYPQHLTLSPAHFWPELVLVVLGPLALLAARRFPGPVVAIASAAALGGLFFVAPDDAPFPVAVLFALVSAVARGARVWAWISVGSAWILSITWSLIAGLAWSPPRVAFTTLAILVSFGVGESMRTRRERFAEFQRIRTQRRQSEVQAERVRIARELHDVLAHSLSQINVQAGVGLHLMDTQPDKARDALANIKESSKSALDEVRSVLGVLRSNSADEDAPLVPEPDLSRIDWLAAAASTRGVEVSVIGAPHGVPQAIQLAMFRIVQESLTNIARHAHATTAVVELGAENGFYSVTVTDNGTAPTPTGDTEGRGLLGMRERAELLGGTLHTGPNPGGGFRVEARIPIREKAGAS